MHLKDSFKPANSLYIYIFQQNQQTNYAEIRMKYIKYQQTLEYNVNMVKRFHKQKKLVKKNKKIMAARKFIANIRIIEIYIIVPITKK